MGGKGAGMGGGGKGAKTKPDVWFIEAGMRGLGKVS